VARPPLNRGRGGEGARAQLCSPHQGVRRTPDARLKEIRGWVKRGGISNLILVLPATKHCYAMAPISAQYAVIKKRNCSTA
jgi:hypothetical protein